MLNNTCVFVCVTLVGCARRWLRRYVRADKRQWSQRPSQPPAVIISNTATEVVAEKSQETESAGKAVEIA